MPGGRQRSESKRKLFRTIATRISYHNHASSAVDKEDFRDDKDKDKDRDDDGRDITAVHSPYNDSTNINTNINTNNNNIANVSGISNSSNTNMCTHSSSMGQQQQMHDEYVCSGNSRQQQVPLPVTQGSDQTHFSYLESVKKAPTKKRPISGRSEIITPTANLKMNNANNTKIRSVLSNNLNTNVNSHRVTSDSMNLDTCSPVTETSANTDMSFLSKTDSMIINTDHKFDMNEYDYKTFSTKHPLRFSKVKAFEQAELTAKRYFSSRNENGNANGNGGNVNSKVIPNNSSNTVADDEIIIQIPGMSVADTAMILGHESAENKITESTSRLNNQRVFGQTPAERRLYLMKNAMKQMTREDMINTKLEQSKLPNLFQNSGDFLKEMDPQELEFWELMNEEFDNDMHELKEEFRVEEERMNSLVDEETVKTFFERVKSNRRSHGKRYPGVEKALGAIICQKVKDDLHDEDQFVLNTGN